MYDSLKGADLGDELYVEGMDDAFLEWRAQHGQEWARYYGLTVRPLLNSLPAAPPLVLASTDSQRSYGSSFCVWSYLAVAACLAGSVKAALGCNAQDAVLPSSLHAVCVQELPTSRAQVDQVTMQTRSMLPPPRQAAQLLSRETSRSAPLRLDLLSSLIPMFLSLTALHSITLAERLLASPDNSVPQFFFCQKKDRAPTACDIVVYNHAAACQLYV